MREPRPCTASILCPGPSLSNVPFWALESDLVVFVNGAIRFPVEPMRPWRWMLNDHSGWARFRDCIGDRKPILTCPKWKQQPDDEIYERTIKEFVDFEQMRKTITWAPFADGWSVSTMTRCIAVLVQKGWKRIDIFGCQLDVCGYYGSDVEDYSTEDRWRHERQALNVLIRCGDEIGVTIRRV